MVDLMVEERNTLEAENRLLSEKAKPGDAEMEAALTELQADKALLEDELEDLTEKNVVLAESLAESEYQRRMLARDLEAAQKAALYVEEEPEQPKQVAVPLTSSEGNEVGTLFIAEQPEDPAEPIVLEIPLREMTESESEPKVLPQTESLSPPADPAPAPDRKEKKSRIRGPRKFR